MSVNDDLPWIAPMLDLIRRAVGRRMPVIGHCLGGQLLAKALGGEVRANPVKEIGWGEIEVVNRRQAGEWGPRRVVSRRFTGMGRLSRYRPGAVRIWASAHCANQAFVYGPSIGMQCHIEMTEEMVETWCASGAEEIEDAPAPQPRGAVRPKRCARTAAKVERCTASPTASTPAGPR